MFKSSIVIHNKTLGEVSDNFNKEELLTPPMQRLIDKNKVDEIVEFQSKYYEKHNHFNFVGTIIIIKYNSKLYLIDGQHRYTAYKILYNKYKTCSIIVELIIIKDLEEMGNIYSMINKNTPLPEFSSFIKKQQCEDIASYFYDKYNIWTNKKPSRPRLNKNDFAQSLESFIDDNTIPCIKNKESIIAYIENINNFYSKVKVDEICDGKKITANMLSKCKSENFYLGLFSYNSTDSVYKWFNDRLHINKKNRSKVSNTLRSACWNKYVGKNNANALCICCKSHEIHINEFHAGHIVSVANGGKTNINNLLPICVKCNQSMGTILMDDFIKRDFPDNYTDYEERKFVVLNKK